MRQRMFAKITINQFYKNSIEMLKVNYFVRKHDNLKQNKNNNK